MQERIHTRMKIKQLFRLIILCCFTVVAAITVAGQDRSITSDDFANARPSAPSSKRPSGSSPAPKKAGIKYNLVKRVKKPIRWKSAGKPPTRPVPTGKIVSNDIGVTVWKMRRPLATDAGVKLPVKVGNSVEMWSSVRVNPLSPFKAGDFIRLAVESPTSGYLYVINSEISSTGTYGEPRLIFPDPTDQFNAVTPGMLVDIPDQKEPLPYFKLDPQKGSYAGELVAIIITPVKLDFQLGDKNKILNIGSVIDTNLGVDVQIFSSPDLKDQVYTQAEADAACGSTSRELVREKEEKTPCGSTSRSLTRDEPMPQTIYRVNTYAGRPAVALIELRTRH